MGDSGGHINRSLAVARELPEHEFLFVGGGCVEGAQEEGHGYSSLPMVSTVVRGNSVALAETVGHFARVITGYRRIIKETCRVLEAFKPDLAVTDYEFFLPRAAMKCGVRCLSLDHQHIITHAEHSPAPGSMINRLLTTSSINSLFSSAGSYVVSSFFDLPPKGDRTRIIPPVIKRDILDVNPEEGAHVVVYMRTGLNKELAAGLSGLNRPCRIYGTGKGPQQGNLEFRPSDREGFLADLASCAYVICNGGHTLTSEALQLGKPVLAFPASLFYEQHVNAYYLERLKYGLAGDPRRGVGRALREFEQRLSEFRASLQGKDFFGNVKAASVLRSALAES